MFIIFLIISISICSDISNNSITIYNISKNNINITKDLRINSTIILTLCNLQNNSNITNKLNTSTECKKKK